LRKRFKPSLGHLPLRSNVEFVELDLRNSQSTADASPRALVSLEALRPFQGELNRRDERRKERLRLQQQDQQSHQVCAHPLAEDFIQQKQATVSSHNDSNNNNNSSNIASMSNNNSNTTASNDNSSITSNNNSNNHSHENHLGNLENTPGVPSSSLPTFLQALTGHPSAEKVAASLSTNSGLPIKVKQSKSKGKQYIILSNASSRRY